MLKKSFFVFATLLVALTLVACGGGENEEPVYINAPVTLDYLREQTPDRMDLTADTTLPDGRLLGGIALEEWPTETTLHGPAVFWGPKDEEIARHSVSSYFIDDGAECLSRFADGFFLNVGCKALLRPNTRFVEVIEMDIQAVLEHKSFTGEISLEKHCILLIQTSRVETVETEVDVFELQEDLFILSGPAEVTLDDGITAHRKCTTVPG